MDVVRALLRRPMASASLTRVLRTAVLAAFVCAGCYGSAGRAPDDAGRVGWSRPDVALSSGCSAVALELLCSDTPIVAETPATIEVSLGPDGCWCGQTLTCEAEVVGDHQLALTTGLCPSAPVCDACEGPPRGECALPPLAPGSWLVLLHGELGGVLEVVPPGTPSDARVCRRRLLPDPVCEVAFPAAFVDVARACHPSAITPGARATIELVESCGGCAVGPCDVVVTRDTIDVWPSRLPLLCDGFWSCRRGCPPTRHRCVTPTLDEGEYDVRVHNLDGAPTRIVVGAGLVGPETCVTP